MIDHKLKDAIRIALTEYFVRAKEKRDDVPRMAESVFLILERRERNRKKK